MAETFFAWSPIRYGDGIIKVGETVTQDQLDVEDDDWNYLVETGAVRTMEYPVPEGSTLSPAEYLRQQAIRLAAGEDLRNVLGSEDAGEGTTTPTGGATTTTTTGGTTATPSGSDK